MKIHHVCVVVSDMEESLKLYRDLLGFKVDIDEIIAEGDFFEQKDFDNIVHVKNAKSRMVILSSEEGGMVELQQFMNPKVQKVPREKLGYGYVGFTELAFRVNGIDEWFEKVKAAGYETQTNYIIEGGGFVRTFLFYDPDGCLVQMIDGFKK